MQLLDNKQLFYMEFSSDSIANVLKNTYITKEMAIFVGMNPVKRFFLIRFFSHLKFLMHRAYVKTFFFFIFRLVSMLYLLTPRLCFFTIFNLDLFFNREDSLMS